MQNPKRCGGHGVGLFDRSSWVAKLGFEQILFHADLASRGVPDCGGPFRGSCDTESVRWIGDQLMAEKSKPQFFALLTLNSHLPVEIHNESTGAMHCGGESALIKDEAVCNLLDLLRKTNQAVADVAARPSLPKTEFIIVGDHAPPFISKERRSLFSRSEVPFIRLVPRE